MNEQFAHHYPPELLELLIDTIPRLLKGKQNVLDFFKGCGVDSKLYADLQQTVRQNRGDINKFQIVRQILARLNDEGDGALRERREVLKRLTQWEDFSSCFDNQRLEAEGLVVKIQKLVNVKDSFTRMDLERERAEREARAKRDAQVAERQRLRAEREQIKADLSALFVEANAGKRGIALEGILNRLFKSHDILVRESFRRLGNSGEGVVEQIDGVVDFDGHVYLVEMKWWSQPLGPSDIAPHLVRVLNREGARGVLVSQAGYTAPAIAQVRELLSKSVFVLTNLEEIVLLLAQDGSLLDLLRAKVQAAILDKKPLFEPLHPKSQ